MTHSEVNCTERHLSARIRTLVFSVLSGMVALSAVLTLGGCARHKDYNKGLALMKKKDYRAAAAAFEKVAKKYPDMGEAWFNLGACRYYLAMAAMDAGKKAEALKLIKDSVSAKLKARDLFKKGKFAVIRRKGQRKRVLAQLDRLAEQWKKVGHNDEELLKYLTGRKTAEPSPQPETAEPPRPAGKKSDRTEPSGANKP